jgi:hypothetical protein
VSGEASRTEFERRTGGFIAPVAEMVYGGNGQCVATFPHGGLTVLDQFAISLMDGLISGATIIDWDRVAEEAYLGASAMLERKRIIEGT